MGSRALSERAIHSPGSDTAPELPSSVGGKRFSSTPCLCIQTRWNSISIVSMGYFLILEYVAWRIHALALPSITFYSYGLCNYPGFPVTSFPVRILQALVRPCF